MSLVHHTLTRNPWPDLLQRRLAVAKPAPPPGCGAQGVDDTVILLASRQISAILLRLGKLDLTSPAGKMMLTMLAAVAEMERDMLVERTQAGAKSEGKTLGRPSKTSTEQRADIIAKYAAGESVSALSRQYQVSRASILGVVKPV